jgi:hypothetical protein
LTLGDGVGAFGATACDIGCADLVRASGDSHWPARVRSANYGPMRLADASVRLKPRKA